LIETKEEEPDELLQILATQMTPHQQEGAIVQTTLDGQVSMQLDTGATVTVLGETTWEDVDYPKLQSSDIKL